MISFVLTFIAFEIGGFDVFVRYYDKSVNVTRVELSSFSLT